MSQYDSKVQNLFLSQLRKKHQKVEVVLETGNVLRGKLKSYDQFSVTLSFKDQIEIVYKSSIIYITAIPSLPEKKPFRSNPRGSYGRPNYRDDYRSMRDDEQYRPYKPSTTPPGYGDEEDSYSENTYYRKPYKRNNDFQSPSRFRPSYKRDNYQDREDRENKEDRPYRPPRKPY